MQRDAMASLCLACSCFIVSCGGGPSQDAISGSIERQLSAESEEYLDHRDAMIRYYEFRSYAPAWVNSDGPTEAVARAAEAFCNAGSEGLWPASYATPSLAAALQASYEDGTDNAAVRADQLASLDLQLTHAYMAYASDLLTGRVDPRELGTGWNAPVHEVDLAEVMTDSAGSDRRFELHRLLSDRHEGFGSLRTAFQTYQKIAAQGGWNPVPPGDALEMGVTGQRVARLRDRLAASGDLMALDTTFADSARFDSAIAAAVARFQKRHGLEPDSVAGSAVIDAMNVPVEERLRQIELNLERWRWIPANLGSRYLYVNIPAFELHAFEGDEEALSMRVVVGREYNDQATPVFSDTMQYVVFRPYWNVPESIATDEIVPAAREDPGYLARNDYEIVRGWDGSGRISDPGAGDLDRVESGALRIRQRPGPENALGQIKFMFPNEFNIYLHDTPAEHLFERADRAYSHGCIRVEHPVDLAKFVFAGSGMTENEVRERMAGDESQTVNLEHPLPVYILYWTAFVDDGVVNFRNDLYGQDTALESALAAISPGVSDDEGCRLLRIAEDAEG